MACRSAEGATSATTRLAIDLDAIAANWRLLRRRHRGDVAGVLKADGYGLGAARVAPRLLSEGCRHFFTAHPQEARAIRPLLGDAMLGVLNGLCPDEARSYVEHDLLPALGTLREIEEWSGEARRLGRALPALLHLDTGMNRLGLDAEEFDALVRRPWLLDGVELRYVMTHLCAADTPDSLANAAQRVAFARDCARLDTVLDRSLPRSVANSSGLFLGDGFGSDLARPGAALYGINPVPGRPNPMRPVLRLSAMVLSVRTVPTGASVGYNGAWTAGRDSRIATVGAGYADGLPRALSNAGRASFDGRPVPLVGRVSMDLTTFDVTDHPAVRPGAWLELIGPDLPPDEVAACAGTSAYEILTSLGPRYERDYTAL
jgi:alanine racemase